MTEELRVPTVTYQTELLFRDGSTLRGRMFLPATAKDHDGPTRPVERLNESDDFLPFLPEGEPATILSKRQIVQARLRVDELPEDEVDASLPHQSIRILCAGRLIDGSIALGSPDARVLDELNHAGRFVAVRDERHQYLINKTYIMRVTEV